MHGSASFGQWLKQRRRDLDMRQEELSKRVGCSKVLLQKLESDERRPSKQLAILLARALAVPAGEHSMFVRFARQVWSPSSDRRDVFENTRAPWRSQYRTVTNMPSLPHGLIGREEALDNIVSLVAEDVVRLVTLYGPPGVGKTSLALAAAHQLLDDFDDGIVFIELAQVDDADSVLYALLRALRVSDASNITPMNRLEAYLHGRRMLLVFDNFEHVLTSRSLLSTLLSQCPWIKILVTSRVVLRLRGERRVLVQPLNTAPTSSEKSLEADSQQVHEFLKYSAVKMFVEHAFAGVSPVSFDRELARNICALCSYLNGLPLAIELAAAQVPRLTVIQLLEALKSQQLSLTDGAIDGPEHHQSLEQALEQSYRLLEYPARILLQALSIFRSAASTGAILAVIRDVEQVPNKSVARLLNMLVDHSLLYRQKSSQKLVRYGMLEPVRQDAMSRLRQGGLGVQLYSGFVMYYVDLVAQAASGLNGSEELYWLAVVDAEIANLEAAWVWALAHNNYDQAAEIIAPIWRYWTIRGLYSTGVMWLERVLAFDSELRIENRAAIRLALAELVSHLGDEQRTHMLLDECLTLYREIPGDIGQIGMAYTLWELHWRSRTEGAIDRARERLNEALLLFKRNNDVWGHIAVLSDLGSLAMACRDLQLARRIFDESLSLAEALANPSLKAICYNNCAWLAREEHDINQAQTMTAACLGLARVLGHNSLEAVQLYCQALVLARQLNYHRAQARIEESIAILEGLGDQRWLAHALTLFADLLWLQGESSLAHGVIQRALAVYQGIGDIHGMVGSLQSVGLICASLGHFQQAEAALLESLAHGTSMDGAEKAVAHTLLCLAYLASEQELWILAAQLTHSSDRMFEQHDCCVEPYLEPVVQRVKSLVDKHATSVTASEANRQIRHAIESYNLDREPHSLAREWRDTSTM